MLRIGKNDIMSTVGLSSSLLSQIVSSPSTENRFVSDLNQLAQDLQGGNLSAAQQDYVTLSEDAQNGAASSTATTSASGITTGLLTDIASSSSSSASFVSELNQLGTDLQSGDLSSAQSDMLSIDSTALNAAPAAGTGTNTGSSTAANEAQANQLISTIVQAMDMGDNSLVSSGLSELASLSSNSTGVSVLEQASQSFGSSTDSSSTSSITQLLQGLDTSGDSSTSALSLLA
jgi:hypothetical protein